MIVRTFYGEKIRIASLSIWRTSIYAENPEEDRAHGAD